MKQFLESICIRDGHPQHLHWHQRRIDATLQHFYPAHHHTWNLQECINIPVEFQAGLVKCRIIYDAHHFESHFYPYQQKEIQTLKAVQIPTNYDYRYKYLDRGMIENMFSQKDGADDILMITHGWVRDTSIANIAFQKKGRWYTPAFPLLAGTTWKRLIAERILIPRPINQTEILTFECFKVFNALNSFEASKASPVSNIK